MSEIRKFDYNKFPIEFQVTNENHVYGNATLMCKPFGKRPIDWSRLPQTQRLFNALKERQKEIIRKTERDNLAGIKDENALDFESKELCENLTINKSDDTLDFESKAVGENLTAVLTEAEIEEKAKEILTFTNVGGNGATWISEKLIMSLARWLDVEFEIWCDEKLSELIREGSVSIVKPNIPNFLDPAEAAIEWANQYKRAEDEKGQKLIAHKVIEEQKPKVEAFDSVINDDNTYTLDVVSDVLDIGRNSLSRLLKMINWAVTNTVNGTASTRFGELNGYAKTVYEQVKIGDVLMKKKRICITKAGVDYLVANKSKLVQRLSEK